VSQRRQHGRSHAPPPARDLSEYLYRKGCLTDVRTGVGSRHV
jgi:hypothetical protein